MPVDTASLRRYLEPVLSLLKGLSRITMNTGQVGTAFGVHLDYTRARKKRRVTLTGQMRGPAAVVEAAAEAVRPILAHRVGKWTIP